MSSAVAISMISAVGHVVAAMAFGWLVLVGYRYIASRSSVVGAIFAITILTRAALGLALFWVSYLRLPIAQSLQRGDGFWQMFLDAAGTHQNAARAAETHQLYGLDHSLAAPLFHDVYAIWLMIVGISPAAGLFLNLCFYTLLVTLIVRFFSPVNEWRSDLPCIVGVAGYSLSPATLVNSTQPLKDEMAVVIVAILCLATLTLVRFLREPAARSETRTAAAAITAIALAIFCMAGVRWYFAFIMWCAVALVLAIFAFRGRVSSSSRYGTGSIAVLIAGWLAIWFGTGQYYAAVGLDFGRLSNPSGSRALQQIREFPSYLLMRVRISRTGFLTSGGGTNIVIPLRTDSAAGEARARELMNAADASAFHEPQVLAAARIASLNFKSATLPVVVPQPTVTPKVAPQPTVTPKVALQPTVTPRVAPQPTVTPSTPTPGEGPAKPPDQTPYQAVARAIPVGIFDEFMAVGWGLALFFVPISLVLAAGGIAVAGGRGLLHVTEVDTVFLDIAVLSMVALLWRRRRAIGDRLPLVVFGAILCGTTVVLLGYSVTNFGTLWRMRPMAIIPLWVMAVALSPRLETPQKDVTERATAVASS